MDQDRLWLPPLMRFIVELTTWLWLLLFNFILLVLSVISLALLNYPGDKRPQDTKGIGVNVPGILRIFVEINSAILGIIAAFEILSVIGLVFQVTITLFSFYLDYDRWLWMVGRKPMPNYVSYVHKKAKK
ncbi:MAG: hypothetical protein GPJ54_16365 [Candidatus Heimdallarchaeota archaeon]|nr:hypothetical protein [Candidatus Heimdallarchaeota archaeon]